MATIRPEDLRKAYRKERDPRVKIRMAAVNMVCMNNESIQHTADSLMQCPNWVSMWVERFKEGGIVALRDLPRPGRPSRVERGEMERIMRGASGSRTIATALQQDIRQKTGVSFHITYVRKLMHRYGLTPKAATAIHVNRAGSRAVNSWRHRAKRRISRLKTAGFTILAEDESFFIHDTKSGRKYWSPAGTRITVPYTGSHKKVTVYGAVTDGGKRFFRVYDAGFNKETFIRYVAEMNRRFGKIAVVLDRAPPHCAKALKQKFGRNGDVRFVYLPRGSLYLNMIEEYWRQAKRRLLVSEYYPTFSDMRRAVSEYFRTSRLSLDMYAYLDRWSAPILKNF